MVLIFGNFTSSISLEGKEFSWLKGKGGCLCERGRPYVLNQMMLCIIFYIWLCVVNPPTLLPSLHASQRFC